MPVLAVVLRCVVDICRRSPGRYIQRSARYVTRVTIRGAPKMLQRASSAKSARKGARAFIMFSHAAQEVVTPDDDALLLSREDDIRCRKRKRGYARYGVIYYAVRWRV